MMNQLVVVGIVKSLEEGKLTIFIPDNEFTITLNISESFYNRSKEHIKEDMLVAVKGKLKLNAENNLDIAVEKIFGLDQSLEKKHKKQSYKR